MRPLLALVLLSASLAGCAQTTPHGCGPSPASAIVRFDTTEPRNDTLGALIRLGWRLDPGERDNLFEGALTANGTRYELHGVIEGTPDAPAYRLLLRAPDRPAATNGEAHDALAPAAGPLLARFQADVEYHGAQVCA